MKVQEKKKKVVVLCSLPPLNVKLVTFITIITIITVNFP